MNLKQSIPILAILLFAFACKSPQTSDNEEDKISSPEVSTKIDTLKPPMVGNDSDEHGCKGSAGYQWSVIRKECIRIFESGIRMNPEAPS